MTGLSTNKYERLDKNYDVFYDQKSHPGPIVP